MSNTPNTQIGSGPNVDPRPLTSDEWLHVRAEGRAAYNASMASSNSEEKAALAADEARDEALMYTLLTGGGGTP